QCDFAAPTQASGARFDRGPLQTGNVVGVVVAEDEIGRQDSDCGHDLRAGEIAAMDENVGPFRRQEADRELYPRQLIVRVREDAEPHLNSAFRRWVPALSCSDHYGLFFT